MLVEDLYRASGSCSCWLEVPVFSSATKPTKIYYIIFVGQAADENRLQQFRLPVADENRQYIFVGLCGRRKYIYFRRPNKPTKIYSYFRRQPTKIILFSSSLFRRPIFVGKPMKMAIFVGIRPIFVGFWPTKMSCFPVVSQCEDIS
jgi:hypothetical protein